MNLGFPFGFPENQPKQGPPKEDEPFIFASSEARSPKPEVVAYTAAGGALATEE